MRPGQRVDKLIVVAHEELQIVAQIDSVEFVVARLTKGAIVNHRTFLEQHEQNLIKIKCEEHAHILVLTHSEMKKLSTDINIRFPIVTFIERLHKNNKLFQVDYVVPPQCISEFPNKKCYKVSNTLNRRMILQNIALRIIHVVRFKKSAPTLTEVIENLQRRFKLDPADKKYRDHLRSLIRGKFAKPVELIQSQQRKRFDNLTIGLKTINTEVARLKNATRHFLLTLAQVDEISLEDLENEDSPLPLLEVPSK